MGRDSPITATIYDDVSATSRASHHSLSVCRIPLIPPDSRRRALAVATTVNKVSFGCTARIEQTLTHGFTCQIPIRASRRLAGGAADFPLGRLGYIESPRGVRFAATHCLHDAKSEGFLITGSDTALFRYTLRMPKAVAISVAGGRHRPFGPLGYCGPGVSAAALW